METQALPYGVLDLTPAVDVDHGPPRRVRCYVRGCDQVLRTPTRDGRGDHCPIHGIRCHFSGQTGQTYSYTDVRRNIICAQELFVTQIVGHPFKYESHRLGSENSEDAVSWNVFRSLQEAGQLHEIARWITGLDIEREPIVYLWGIEITDNRFTSWDLLIAARNRFESNLPVVRPLTEPDIALWLPGEYLVLIEAKFTSPNPFYMDGPRKDASSLTKEELLDIYRDEQLCILDRKVAKTKERIFYQLWRNTVFAEWMALGDDRKTQAYHANLTCAGRESESCNEFRSLVRPEFQDRFAHVAWEDIYHLATGPASDRLRRYLDNKTARLKPAFRLKR